jgi:hypothetical protein
LLVVIFKHSFGLLLFALISIRKESDEVVLCISIASCAPDEHKVNVLILIVAPTTGFYYCRDNKPVSSGFMIAE